MITVATARIEPASTAVVLHTRDNYAPLPGTFNGEATVTIGRPDDRPKCQTLGDAAGQLGFRGRGKMGRKALRSLARGR